MSKLLYSCLLSTILLLTACGGGSSSGGGESDGETASETGETSNTSTTPVSDIAGTYVGTATVTASGGGLSETGSAPVQITISENNSVAFGKPGEPPIGTTTLNTSGDAFEISVPASFFNRSGIECTGTLSASGTVNGGAITGAIASSGVTCNGIPGTVNGSFSLDKT